MHIANSQGSFTSCLLLLILLLFLLLLQIYAPVCGVDNSIYANKCLAGCIGVQTATDKVSTCLLSHVQLLDLSKQDK